MQHLIRGKDRAVVPLIIRFFVDPPPPSTARVRMSLESERSDLRPKFYGYSILGDVQARMPNVTGCLPQINSGANDNQSSSGLLIKRRW